jgi:hypothetical protein
MMMMVTSKSGGYHMTNASWAADGLAVFTGGSHLLKFCPLQLFYTCKCGDEITSHYGNHILL